MTWVDWLVLALAYAALVALIFVRTRPIEVTEATTLEQQLAGMTQAELSELAGRVYEVRNAA